MYFDYKKLPVKIIKITNVPRATKFINLAFIFTLLIDLLTDGGVSTSLYVCAQNNSSKNMDAGWWVY